MKLLIGTLDVETGIHNRGDDAIGKMKAAPWHPNNHIVHYGEKMIDASKVDCNMPTRWDTPSYPLLLVGQNIKFDLHFIMKDVDGFRENVWPMVQIWDTMLAEYLLTGQVSQYASLDRLAAKYGGTLKDDQVKEMWDEGIDTEDIPREIIIPYLENDVLNTELVFKAQYLKAKELGMVALIKVQMNALKATTEMEWNGMHFDKQLAKEGKEELVEEMDLHAAICEMEARHFLTAHFFEHNFKLSSTAHIALILFGGEYKYKVDELMLDDERMAVLYKSGKKKGQRRYQKKEIVTTTTGWGLEVRPTYATPSGKTSTADGVLRDILTNPMPVGCKEFVNSLLAYRKCAKDISTYFEGYAKLVWPDGIIHHNLNHCGTDTGRLSSSRPNLQNVSSKNEE